MNYRHVILTVLLLILLPAGRLRAGPPFVTDDPEPVDYQHWEVYLFSDFNHARDGDFAQFPAVEVNYGLLPEMQIHLIAPLAYERDAGGDSHWGYGDTELGMKYRLIQETETIPQVGVFPLIELPSGDSRRGLGNGKAQVFLPVWLQKSFGKDKEWTTYGGGGFWYNPGEDQRNFFRVGWELQRDFGQHLTLGGEIFHETSSARGEDGHTAFNVGAIVNFDEHNHLLASVGRDIDGPNRFACYLGYQLTF